MEDDKKISPPKPKKAISASKKKPAAEKESAEFAESRKATGDLQTDSGDDVKPARKASKKTAAGKTAKKSPVAETPAIAAEAKPGRRKTPSKKSEITKEPETKAKKGAPKTAKSKTVKNKDANVTAAPAPENLFKIEDIIEPETLRQIEAIAEAETAPEKKSQPETQNILPSATKTAPATEVRKTSENQESPIFKELAAPKLPVLNPENRARLQIQSPTKIFFYWSLKSNPFATLQKIFSGRGGNYALVAKLQNRTDGTEQIFPIDTSGSWWFDVEPDSQYRAEVGFFDARRPFIRLLFSNTVETPRRAPSPHFDRAAQFVVSAREFAEVLDVSGYRQDAFEIALAGDDTAAGDAKTFEVFAELTGTQRFKTKPAELRLALFALAAGLSLPDLDDRISPSLFAYLEKLIEEKSERLAAEKILSALEESFGFGAAETISELPEIAYSVFGASRINFQKFPKQFWKRFAPVSSFKVIR